MSTRWAFIGLGILIATVLWVVLAFGDSPEVVVEEPAPVSDSVTPPQKSGDSRVGGYLD